MAEDPNLGIPAGPVEIASVRDLDHEIDTGSPNNEPNLPHTKNMTTFRYEQGNISFLDPKTRVSTVSQF